MRTILDLVDAVCTHSPAAPAVIAAHTHIPYSELARSARGLGDALTGYGGITPGARVAIFLDKRIETVVSILGAVAAGCVFVPVNPLLRPAQIAHILLDCTAQCLVTTIARARVLASHNALVVPHVVLVDCCRDATRETASFHDSAIIHTWPVEARTGGAAIADADSRYPGTLRASHSTLDTDLGAILYTSGSTGAPKGVMVSHRNLLEGAWSVAHYLHHTANDRLLAALPLSFDAGLNQLTAAWAAGASSVLVNYLAARDVVDACATEGVTAITGVPPLWMQLSRVAWPEDARTRLRYIASTGGHMPPAVLQKLRALFPQARPFLMYGLTEAFRSTYLEPAELDRRPGSIGKAVPNARVLVVREDGSPCAPGETGELVHTGAFVTLGYWNDSARTALRYRPSPEPGPGGAPAQQAVWSGDLVRSDAEGFLYFVARQDGQIKTSGYRVSPEEVEDVAHASGLVSEAVASGTPDAELGEVITLRVVPASPATFDPAALRDWFAQRLPPYMVPAHIVTCASLPRNPNGKFDRSGLQIQPEPRSDAHGGARP